jgi:hypothetical protein
MPEPTESALNNPAARIIKILKYIDTDRSHEQIVLLLGKAINARVTHALPTFETLVDDLEYSIQVLSGMKLKQSMQAVAGLRVLITAIKYESYADDLRPYLSNDLLSLLEKCSAYLSGHDFEIDAPVLDELHKDIENLRDQVMDTDLDVEIAEFIYSSLDQLSMAVQNYRFAGKKGLLNSVELCIGKSYIFVQIQKTPDLRDK